nr:hypothetical protein BN887_04959 [Melanopsichium pennsylvanicum 4]
MAYKPSKRLHITHACRIEQQEGAFWFNTPDTTTPSDQLSHDDAEESGLLSACYAECLWLGEFHTGLSHFLDCIDRLKLSYKPEDILTGLCLLVKSNSAISRRHRATACELPHVDRRDTDTHDMGVPYASEYEKKLIQFAIQKIDTGNASSQLASGEANSLRDRWISSMESREIQLQILVTMCLLQIVSQEPRALELARAWIAGESAPILTKDTATSMPAGATQGNESVQPRKRSRKLEKARRWRGKRPHSDSNDVFAWNQSVRRRLATDSSHDDGENGEAEVLELEGEDVLTVDHLSKRLEALVDILCLRQVAEGVGSEVADLLSDMSSETTGSDRNDQGKSTARANRFGSSVRKLVEDDDRDDAQWLCSSVVEPHFEASLPRQCCLFRSKCFVSLQSRTPGRPTKSNRTGSMGSPPSRAVKRSASIATAGSIGLLTGSGLSDVLEKEQAGRRVKRNILAERSSILGRGREVDMGRRLSRSISATSGPVRESQAPIGVFSRSNTSASFSQLKNEQFAEPLEASSGVKATHGDTRSASQRAGKIASVRSDPLLSTPSFAASSSTSKRLLVMSTPQKEAASKTFKMGHLSEKDKPRLAYPNALVMESPSRESSQCEGQKSQMARRCASFGGRISPQIKRTPSPVGIYFDVDE